MEQSKQIENHIEEQELTEQLMMKEEKVRALQKEIAEKNKRIKQIEKSNTFKLANLLRPLKKMFGITEKEKQLLATLEAKLAKTEKELFAAKEQIHELKLKDTEIHTNEVYEYIRKMKDDGELLSFIDSLIVEKKQQQKNYQEALTYAARLYMNADAPKKHVLYEKIFQGLKIEEIPEFMIRSGLTDEPIPLTNVASFRANLNIRMRKQQHQMLPEWYFDDKRTSYEFVKSLGVTIPFVDDTHYTIESIPKRTEIVIKPVDAAGARGVYLVHDIDDIFDVRNSIPIRNWEDLQLSMQKDLETGAVERDEWMVEQLIYENKAEKVPARDVKFYCFYGKVGIILEIIREPEVRHCWWTADGKRVSAGKYDESLFAGLGVSEEELKMAEDLSKQIPAPFIRIDFLKGENGLVFGEFTPKPGNYDEFDDETDRLLGDYFLEAEAKLINDLIEGKQFENYHQFITKLGHETV